ncbi:MAG: PEGA domain-containing protein [Bradymonadia bacterium]
MKRAMTRGLALWLTLGLGAVAPIAAPTVAQADSADWAAVMVFARDGADANTAVRIERDLRNMFEYAHSEGIHEEGKKVPRVRSIERRYDVGMLSKGNLEKARRHFNNAQRHLEKGEPDEAQEQLKRANIFYNRALPYSSDSQLLRGIYFYQYLGLQGAKDEAGALNAYCSYVALTRNLAGSAGPLEQFEPLADKCGTTTSAGTAELKITANIDGAHVYVDERPVGVIGQSLPYANPFIPAGPHLVEVRKAGYARWGTLVNLESGKSVSVKAKLKEARNRAEAYDTLYKMIFRGADAFSEEYRIELAFQMADRFQVGTLVAAYLEPDGEDQRLTLFTFKDGGLEQESWRIPKVRDSHYKVLSRYWNTHYGKALEVADAIPIPDRWAPTLFKVE